MKREKFIEFNAQMFWIELVIKSCSTVDHLQGAVNLVDSFYRKYKKIDTHRAIVSRICLMIAMETKVTELSMQLFIDRIFSNRININL